MSKEVCVVPVGMSTKQFKDFRKNVSSLEKKCHLNFKCIMQINGLKKNLSLEYNISYFYSIFQGHFISKFQKLC